MPTRARSVHCARWPGALVVGLLLGCAPARSAPPEPPPAPAAEGSADPIAPPPVSVERPEPASADEMPALPLADDFTGRLEVEVTDARPGTPFSIVSEREGLTYIDIEPADPSLRGQYRVVFCPAGELDPERCNEVTGLGVGGEHELLIAGPPGRVVIVVSSAD